MEISYFIKKRNKNDKNTFFLNEKQQKNAKKVYVTRHTEPWCNMLQTLEIGENIGDKKSSVKHTQ